MPDLIMGSVPVAEGSFSLARRWLSAGRLATEIESKRNTVTSDDSVVQLSDAYYSPLQDLNAFNHDRVGLHVRGGQITTSLASAVASR